VAMALWALPGPLPQWGAPPPRGGGPLAGVFPLLKGICAPPPSKGVFQARPRGGFSPFGGPPLVVRPKGVRSPPPAFFGFWGAPSFFPPRGFRGNFFWSPPPLRVGSAFPIAGLFHSYSLFLGGLFLSFCLLIGFPSSSIDGWIRPHIICHKLLHFIYLFRDMELFHIILKSITPVFKDISLYPAI